MSNNKSFSNTNTFLDTVLLTGLTTLQNETITGNAAIQGNLTDNGNTTIAGNISVNGATNVIGNSNSTNSINGSTTCQALTANTLTLSNNLNANGTTNTIGGTAACNTLTANTFNLSGNITTTGVTNNIGKSDGSGTTNLLGTTNTNILTCSFLNTISSTRIGYLSTIQSNVQTQLTSKQPLINSSVDVTGNNFTVNSLNTIPAATIAFLDATSSIQSQLTNLSSSKTTLAAVQSNSNTFTGSNSFNTSNPTTTVVASGNYDIPNKLYVDTGLSGKQASLTSSSDITLHNVTVNQLNGISSATLGYMDATSSITTQLNSKQPSLTSSSDIALHNVTVNQLNGISTSTLANISTLSSNAQNQISNIMLKPDRWFYGVGTYKNIDPTYSTVSYVYPDLTQTPSVYINWIGDSTATTSMMSSALLEINYELIGGYTHSTTVSTSGIQPISYTSGSPPTNLLNAWFNYVEVYQEPAGLTTNSSSWFVAGWGSQSNSKASLLGTCNYMQYKQSGPASPYIAPTAVPFIPITPIYVSNKKMQLTFAFPNVLAVQVATVVTLPGYITGIRISVKIVNSMSCLTGTSNGYFGMQNSEISGGGFSASGGAYLSSS